MAATGAGTPPTGGRILVVDDEPSIRAVLRAHLRRAGHAVRVAASGEEATRLLDAEPCDLLITDLKMPGMDGMALLRWCQRQHPGLPVVILTAHGTVDSAVEALKRGARDYITKPFDLDEMLRVVERTLHLGRVGRGHLHDPAGEPAILGRDPAIRRVRALIDKVAASPTPVLIAGESGTGKELVARALHARSTRAGAPFIPFDCAALPAADLGPELFGRARGAWPGSSSPRPGALELAAGGTLYLAGVDALPPPLQARLLAVLQEGRYRRTGGIRELRAEARVVASTARDLQQAVRAGAFREELYYRLAVIRVDLPPLRERAGDIEILVDHFADRFARRLGRRVRGLTPEARAALLAHPWPGNIRELEQVIERAVLLAEGDRIDRDALGGLGEAGAEPPPPPADEQLGLKEYVRVHTMRLERRRIARALAEAGGNVTHAARRLGISRKSLQVKMKEYGLRRARPPGSDDGSPPT